MSEVSYQQDDWNVPCSDDENYGVHGKVSINFCAISLRKCVLNSFVFVVWQGEVKLLSFMCTPPNTRKGSKEISLRDL
jgi:hypothetical protein